MPVTVNVGELLECDQNDNIRTRGCDPCVALIVIFNNGGAGQVVKRCAHFSVGMAGPYTQGHINAALNPILANYFPLDESNVLAVGFTWGGYSPGMGAVQICNRLREYFNGLNVLESATQDSLTTNGNVIQALNMMHWAFTFPLPHNQEAELS